jgi:hypothetical protein
MVWIASGGKCDQQGRPQMESPTPSVCVCVCVCVSSTKKSYSFWTLCRQSAAGPSSHLAAAAGAKPHLVQEPGPREAPGRSPLDDAAVQAMVAHAARRGPGHRRPLGHGLSPPAASRRAAGGGTAQAGMHPSPRSRSSVFTLEPGARGRRGAGAAAKPAGPEPRGARRTHQARVPAACGAS